MGAYFVWTTSGMAGIARMDVLKGFDGSRLNGTPLASVWPNDAYFQMSPNFKKDKVMVDSHSNLEGEMLVSAKVRDLFVAQGVQDVEYLKAAIKNHAGEIVSTDYFVVNPLKVVDCIDKDASQLMWNNIDPTHISSIFKLVLKPDAMDPTAKIFRLKHKTSVILVRQDLADAVNAAGLKGPKLKPSESHMG